LIFKLFKKILCIKFHFYVQSITVTALKNSTKNSLTALLKQVMQYPKKALGGET